MKVHQFTFSDSASPGVWSAVWEARCFFRQAKEFRAKSSERWAQEAAEIYFDKARAMMRSVRLMVRGPLRRRESV